MRTLTELLDEIPALRGAGAGAPRDDRRLRAQPRASTAASALLREGGPGRRVLRRCATGAVAIETEVPGRGRGDDRDAARGRPARLVVAGAAVPHRLRRARRSSTTHVLAFDGACLRGKCDADPALGYDLLKLLAAVFAERLQDTRLRLLDLYGSGHGGAR